MTYSPQLRALGPFWRILAVFVDAAGASSWPLDEVWDHPAVKSAMLVEGDREEGWNEDQTARTLSRHGWPNADAIYNAAGIPEKHRRVIDLYLMRAGDPVKNRKGYFTLRQISDMTGHPLRTVQLWIHEDVPKLERLGMEDDLAS